MDSRAIGQSASFTPSKVTLLSGDISRLYRSAVLLLLRVSESLF